jgi:hypothetical protein
MVGAVGDAELRGGESEGGDKSGRNAQNYDNFFSRPTPLFHTIGILKTRSKPPNDWRAPEV